ncbi:LysM peptidoglycan-binding domain-containing protein [Streptomyces sp. NBC_01500]|uniref:LysM peptidoglycan-binding domain-containing protein n=1 Tax=Streptomyces sp. NBC_01500 TaxID=2903886 RepID=UPI0022537054|nr:LysM peptidoglycan-binding domain-containing protein [Streptomyces sp. NBC_01500]MCX4554242.1 LysM peptidoglycan-binding domain-containing protein [Streptomyces sp. NBC_01500]
MSPTPTARVHSPSLAVRLLRFVGSATALAVLLAGVPLVLAVAGTLPGGIPTGGDFIDALTQPDDGHVLLAVLTTAAWVLWGWFVLSLIVEIPQAARRRPRHHRRSLGAPQRLAAFLLGSLLLVPAGTAMAASAPAHAASAPLQSHHTSAVPAQTAPGTERGTAERESAGPVHVVGETGETVWDIAVEFLGSGQRAQEIRALNPHLPDSAMLPAGLSVRLPQDATTPDTASAVQEDSVRVQPAANTTGVKAPDRAASYTVHHGDSLSSIADHELGDAGAWPALFAASKGDPQPHGLPAITDPDLIYAGQHIVLPGHDHTRPPAGDDDKHRPTPSKKPGGHHNTGHDTAVPAPASPTTPAPSAPSHPSGKPAEQTPAPHNTGAPQPSTAPHTNSPAPQPTARTAPPAADTAAQDSSGQDSSGQASSSVDIRAVAGAFALLAAAVTGALAVRRILQRRRRRPGQTIAIAEETSPAEAQLAQAAGQDGATSLDRVLRTLARNAADQQMPLPAVDAARITRHGVAIHLPQSDDQSGQPAVPAPFLPGSDGWWDQDDSAELLSEQEAQNVPAPYPALVTIGATPEGHLLLLDLTQQPSLLLSGEPDHVTEVCTSMALELSMAPWASDTEIVVVGFGAELPQLLPTSRILHISQPVHAVRDLGEHLLELHQEPDTVAHPYVILCAAPLDADTAFQMAEAMDKASAPVALVAPADCAVHFPEAAVLDASLTEAQNLDPYSAPVRLQRLDHAAYQQILTGLAVSGQAPEPAEEPWTHVPDPDDENEPDSPGPLPSKSNPARPATDISTSAPESNNGSGGAYPALLAASTDPTALPHLTPAPPAPGHSAPEPTTAPPDVPAAPGQSTPADQKPEDEVPAPEIRVLGPVDVTGVASAGHGPRQAQLAALLYFKPGRTADAICSDMDPNNPWARDTLSSRLHGLRRSLGNAPDGTPYVPRRQTATDPYQISPAVRSDWSIFIRLAQDGLRQGTTGLPALESALALVRGKPFGGRPLPWAEPLQQEMITRITDVAHTVATLRTAPGRDQDLGAARQAIATALEVDDTAELMYRDWLRAEDTAGNRPGVHTAIARLQQVNRSIDAGLEPETEQLISTLLNPSTADRTPVP